MTGELDVDSSRHAEVQRYRVAKGGAGVRAVSPGGAETLGWVAWTVDGNGAEEVSGEEHAGSPGEEVNGGRTGQGGDAVRGVDDQRSDAGTPQPFGGPVPPPFGEPVAPPGPSFAGWASPRGEPYSGEPPAGYSGEPPAGFSGEPTAGFTGEPPAGSTMAQAQFGADVGWAQPSPLGTQSEVPPYQWGYPGSSRPGGGLVGTRSEGRPGAFRWIVTLIVAAVAGGAAGGAIAEGVNGGSSTAPPIHVSGSQPGPALVGGASIPNIVKKVLPSVVSIDAVSPGGGSGFPGLSGGATEAQGSGMIITTTGDVVTNNHVIAGATQVTVTRYGSTKAIPARVIGADPADDLALLQIDGVSGLSPVTFGSATNLQVGDAVVAIGNALALQGGPTVTSGIVSALGRTVQASDTGGSSSENLTNMIQTDAPINSGNSGGPLVDSSGDVIGMNTAVAASSAGNAPAQNIGFAIPSDKIENLIPLLHKGGTVQAGSAYLGVDVETLTPALRQAYSFVPQSGAVVADVVSGSPADSAGIQQGDVIVAFGGNAITNADDLVTAVRSRSPGASVKVAFWRGQVKMTVTATLASTPAS